MPKYKIIDSFEVDPDNHVKAIKTTQSPNWYLQYNLPGVGQCRKSLKTTSKKEARLRAARFANKLLAGDVSVHQRRKTIEEAAAERLTRLCELGRQPKTIEMQDRNFRQLVSWGAPFGINCVDQLTPLNLERFERALRETGVAVPPPKDLKEQKGGGSEVPRKSRKPTPLMPKSVRETMKVVKGLIRHELKRGLVKDPSAGYDLPPGPVEEIVIYSPAELALIFADPDPVLAEVWPFLTHTCLRASEFAWLTKTDVQLEAQGTPTAVHIRRKTCPQTGELWTPKHGNERVVPLTPEATAIVQRGLATSQGPWLFEAPDTNGPQKGHWLIRRLLAKLKDRLRRAGIDHGNLHTFRHAGATMFANAPVRPVPLPILQKLLGHRRITTTQVYLHARAEDVASALRSVQVGAATTPAAIDNNTALPRVLEDGADAA